MSNPTTFTTVADGVPFTAPGRLLQPQVLLTSTSGNVSGTFVLQGTMFPASAAAWRDVWTKTFAAAASPQTDGDVFETAHRAYRWRCTALTGTGAEGACALGSA